MMWFFLDLAGIFLGGTRLHVIDAGFCLVHPGPTRTFLDIMGAFVGDGRSD